MANEEKDVDILANNLSDLLSGELKVGVGLLKVGGSLKREGKNKEWVIKGFRQWMDANEDAVPIIAAALGQGGLDKLKAWLDSKQ